MTHFRHHNTGKPTPLMDTSLWLGQAFLALVFVYSGLMKATQTERKLVAMGQTGVEHLPLPLIRFIGIAELAGVAGLLLPGLTHQLPALTPLAALCLGVIMIPAAIIHYRRGEAKAVWLNAVILLVCVVVAYGRWPTVADRVVPLSFSPTEYDATRSCRSTRDSVRCTTQNEKGLS